MMVRESKGISSFLVRRMDAEEADRAERRARWRAASGTRRLMVLFSMADWMVYVSKIVSLCDSRLAKELACWSSSKVLLLLVP